MTGQFPSNNNEGVIVSDATSTSYQHIHHQQHNKTESTTTITTNIATTPASTTASLHGENKSEDEDDDEEDEHGVESEPNRGADDSGGDSDPHRNYDTISLTPSTNSAHRRRHHGQHGHSHHGHGHGHSHYFHHHSRHRRTPSTSSLASNTLKRGSQAVGGGSGNSCCDYLKVTVSDHQSPKIYVEKCCATAASDHLDDEVERYFYVHQSSGSRKSSVAHGGGSSSQYGSHCSLNRSRCGSFRRRRSDHSITTTADVVSSRTPVPTHRSQERVARMEGNSPMMLEFHAQLEGNQQQQQHHQQQHTNSHKSGGHTGRGRTSSSGSFHRRDDGHYSSNELIPNRYTTHDPLCNSVNNRAYFLGDLDVAPALPRRNQPPPSSQQPLQPVPSVPHHHHLRRVEHPPEIPVEDLSKRMKIRCKHHSLEKKEEIPDGAFYSFHGSSSGLYEVRGGGTFPRSSAGNSAMHSEDRIITTNRPHSVNYSRSGRGSSSCGSLKHTNEGGFAGEFMILTPTKITIENSNNSTMIRFHKSCPTTPELPIRTVEKLPEYACAPSPIQWHFPSSDQSDPNQTTTPSEDTTSTEESQTVIQNYPRPQPINYRKPHDTKTVSIWRTSENSDEEASAIIFHHESGTVENCSNNYCAYFEMTSETNRGEGGSSVKKEKNQLNNSIDNWNSVKPDHSSLERAHNIFPAMSTVRDLSHEVKRFQKASNFEQLNSNNLLSTLERRRQESNESIVTVEPFNSSPFVEVLNNHRSSFQEMNSQTNDPSDHSTDIFHSGQSTNTLESGLDLNRIEFLARRYNKSSPKPSISLTTQNRFPRQSGGGFEFGGLLRGGIRRHGFKKKMKRKARRTQSQDSGNDRLLGAIAGHDEILPDELDSINDGVMRNQSEALQQNGQPFWGVSVIRQSVRRIMNFVTKDDE